MSENISAQQYEAEIDALTRQLNSVHNKIMDSAYKDHYNPFENPTEYRHYNSDYSEIMPEIDEAFAEIPLNPQYRERRRLRRLYNITGIQLIFLMISSNILMYLVSFMVLTILRFVNPETDYSSLTDYFYATSIVPVNLLIFLICNTATAILGMKWSKIVPTSLFKTRDFSVGTAIAYLFIAFAIQYITLNITSVAEEIINNYGFNMYDVNDYMDFETPIALVLEFVYGVIVAPITEELIYRGFVLKNLSKANQRFGIFMSALLFGLMHGTVPQIILGFAMGIFLAHITIKHNSLLPAIIVHIFNNSLYYILSPLDNITSYEGIFIANMIYILVLIVSVFMLIKFILENRLPSSTPHQARRGLSLCLTSFPILILLVLYSYETIANILSIS